MAGTESVQDAARGSTAGRHFSVAFLGLLMVCGGWALAIPIDGAPDEHRHLRLAYALATGQVDGESKFYSVPKYIGENRSLCYAFRSDTSAACDRMGENPTADDMISVSTSANNYPRLYYRMAGWPLVTFDGDSGIYAARLVGVLVSSALLALALTVAWSSGVRWFALGTLVAITPMVTFMIGAFNPHGLELASSLAFIVGLIALLHRLGNTDVRLARAAVLVSVVPLTLARPNGYVWPVLLTALVTLSAPDGWRCWQSQTPRFRRALTALSVPAVLFALAWQVLRGGRDTGAGVFGASNDEFDTPWLKLVQTVRRQQVFPGDWVGAFGWLDVRLSSMTLFAWFAMVGALLVLAVAIGRRRELVWAGVSIVAATLLTSIIDVYYQATLGVSVLQARYVLPLAMLAVILVALSIRDAEPARERMPAIVVALWVAGSLLAFSEAVRRYSLGVLMNSSVGVWQPPLGAATLIVLVGAGLLVTGLLVGRLGRSGVRGVAALTAAVAVFGVVMAIPVSHADPVAQSQTS